MCKSATMDDLELLAQLADIADQLTLPVWQQGSIEVVTKPDGSPVTATDMEVEKRLRALIADVYPDDGFCGEEVGESAGRSGRTWIVDGIDGTSYFTMGRPEWSTLIALVVDGRPLAGMVTSPALDRRWSCSQRSRAQVVVGGQEPQELSVSSGAALAESRVASWPPAGNVKPALRQAAGRLADLRGDQVPTRPSWGSFVPQEAMLVADGQLDAFVLFGGHAWDHAALAAVVTAAGGRFSALDGTTSLDGGSGLYSNGWIHDELLDVLSPGSSGISGAPHADL